MHSISLPANTCATFVGGKGGALETNIVYTARLSQLHKTRDNSGDGAGSSITDGGGQQQPTATVDTAISSRNRRGRNFDRH